MKRKKPSRQDLLSSCSEIGPDDGVDPRTYFRKATDKKNLNRKALQLCGEVARALSHAIAWELGDDLLGTLRVETVVPAPDSTRLLVTVSMPSGPDPALIRERLRLCTGRLRAEVAAAIHRRRVPDLTFHLQERKEVDS
jgi:ribosome-binding factor A